MMQTEKRSAKNKWFIGLLEMKCPACHKGNLYKDMNPFHLRHLGEMNNRCPVCDTNYRIEPGFFFGAAYVSYVMMVLLDGLLALGFFVITGHLFDYAKQFIILVIIVTLLAAPLVFRYSRVIWLYVFIKFKGDSK
jgi:uncharacterized protein (DUF983 family)